MEGEEKQRDGKLGRNQLIASIGCGATLVGSYALVLIGKVDGAAWLSWAQMFVPVSIGIITGSSAAIKITDLIKGRPAPKQ